MIRTVAIKDSSIVDVRSDPNSDLFLDLFKAAALELNVSFLDEKCDTSFCGEICAPKVDVTYSSATGNLCVSVGSSQACFNVSELELVTFNTATNSIAFSGNGTLSFPLAANVKISGNPGNSLVVFGDGLYVPTPVFVPQLRNGLTLVSGTFQELGGTLIHNTTLNLDTFDLRIDSNTTFAEFRNTDEFYTDMSLTFNAYPNSRNDGPSSTPTNFLYTNASGELKTAPFSFLPTPNLQQVTNVGNTTSNLIQATSFQSIAGNILMHGIPAAVTPTYRQDKNLVTTTNATPTVIHSITTPLSNGVYIMEATVSAYCTGGVSGIVGTTNIYYIIGRFKKVGGVITKLGETVVFADEGEPLLDVTTNSSGADIRVVVTGATNMNFTWFMTKGSFHNSTIS